MKAEEIMTENNRKMENKEMRHRLEQNRNMEGEVQQKEESRKTKMQRDRKVFH